MDSSKSRGEKALTSMGNSWRYAHFTKGGPRFSCQLSGSPNMWTEASSIMQWLGAFTGLKTYKTGYFLTVCQDSWPPADARPAWEPDSPQTSSTSCHFLPYPCHGQVLQLVICPSSLFFQALSELTWNQLPSKLWPNWPWVRPKHPSI